MKTSGCVAVVLLGCCAIASADLIDDFESYELGAWPAPNWVAHGNAITEPAKNIVAPDPAGGANQVLKLYGFTGGNWEAVASHAQSFPDEFLFEALIYNGAENIVGTDGSCGIRGIVAMSVMTDTGEKKARELVLFRGDGEIGVYRGPIWTPENWIRIGTSTYATERWYDVAIHYTRKDASNQVLLEYWLDGAYLGNLTSMMWPAVEDSFAHLDLSAGRGTVCYDDVRLDVLPPPGAAVLAGIGLGTAGWRLRRRTR
ncbi:MAG: hypothetical protein JW993_06015 [Sedimentisphaerales bacterium]|nr:hypothetical protein [Sedimentisphaerales bacterium]